jgi:hypothetical protein
MIGEMFFDIPPPSREARMGSPVTQVQVLEKPVSRGPAAREECRPGSGFWQVIINKKREIIIHTDDFRGGEGKKLQ